MSGGSYDGLYVWQDVAGPAQVSAIEMHLVRCASGQSQKASSGRADTVVVGFWQRGGER